MFLVGSPLYSSDVFGYLGYARIGMLHDLSPYVEGVTAVRLDPIDPYVRWNEGVSPYGPLFTLISYAVVPLGIAGGYWAFKLLCAAASLGVIAIVWRLAAARGHDRDARGVRHRPELPRHAAGSATDRRPLQRGAGWAMFAGLATSAWLLPWYVTALLPVAAIGMSPALRAATVLLTLYVVATRVPFLM